MGGDVARISLGRHAVSDEDPVFVIAEIGVNHNGSVDIARRLVDAAARCGAQAVKLQTFSADRLTTASAEKAEYQKTGPDDRTSQRDMLLELELDLDAHRAIKAYAEDAGLVFLSTPFDEESADMLDGLDVAAFKVGSGDLTHLPFLRHLAAKGRPMIVSTGMGTMGEVAQALDVIAATGAPPVILLHCVSNYPADPREANLRAMGAMRAAFRVPVGWSDHMLEPAVGWAAIALGARMVEKHLTLDQSMPGPDHAASLDPDQFRAYVEGIRTVERSLGDGVKRMMPGETPIADVARRSIVCLVDVAAGETLGMDKLGIRRPGTGIRPADLGVVAGRKASVAIRAGTVVTSDMLA